MIALFVVTLGDIVGLTALIAYGIYGVCMWIEDCSNRRRMRKQRERIKQAKETK